MTNYSLVKFSSSTSNKALPILILVFSFFLIFPIDSADAVTTITWSLPAGYIIASGDALGLFPVAATFTVQDTTLSGNTTLDSINVVVTSSTGDSTNLILTESIDNGIFTSSKLLFTAGDDEINILETVTITVEDRCGEMDGIGNCNSGLIETLSAIGEGIGVVSNSDMVGFALSLTETGPNTGLFTTQLSFCTTLGCSNPLIPILEVTNDDIVTVLDQETFALVNSLVVPNSNNVGSVNAVVGGMVTVTYDGVSTPVVILHDGAPGRGGGGLVRPGLVVDSSPPISTATPTGTVCTGDCYPPTLGVDENSKRIVTNGFSYNGNPVDVNLYYTPYPLITVDVGKENVAILKIYDDFGVQNINHVGLGFGLGKGEAFNDSKATINWEQTTNGDETVTLHDPENVLDNVRVESETSDCGIVGKCLVLTIYHTFREELNFNMVATYVWDFRFNGWQNYYNHGIHIVGDSLNPPKTTFVSFGTKDMRGSYELTRIDKLKDHWQDEFGNIYQFKGNDRYDKIYSEPKPFVRDALTSHGCDRNCNWFNELKLEQESLAKITLTKMLDGKTIEGEPLEDPFTIYYHFVKRGDDPVLQQKIKNEIEKATELYMKIYPKRPIHNFLD